jgi:hypothetical protein
MNNIVIPVKAINMEDGSTHNVYPSCNAASSDLNINVGLIHMCCNGKNNVKACKSKNNSKIYRFEYTDNEPTFIVVPVQVEGPAKKRGRPKSSIAHKLAVFTYEELYNELARRYQEQQAQLQPQIPVPTSS